MTGLAKRVAALRGWRRLTLGLCAGTATILAFPPVSFIPALVVTFPLLIWLLDGCRDWKAAFFTGWAFGAGYFITGLYWMTSAFYVDAETFGVFAVPAVGALSIAMGLFIAIVCAITHVIRPADGDDMSYDRADITAERVLLFAAMWTVVEWVRSWIFTGLPWNPLGLVWAEMHTPVGLAVLQTTPLIGTYGLSLITALAACTPAVLGHAPRLARAWAMAAAPLALIAVAAAGGFLRLALAHDDVVAGIKLRLVQANFSQAERSRPSLWAGQLADYVRLSTEDRPADITHVIWGEAAIAYFLNIDETARRVAAQAAPARGMLITGADRGLRTEDGIQAVYNSLYALTPTADIAGVYDKTHLVPFGEYTPLRDLVPFDELTGMAGGFTPGTGLTTLSVAGLPPFSPLICYEAIFSGNVVGDGPPPAWLLNLTNDAWFGLSFGPYQHFAQARLRAVEEGLPLVRTANTGISAVIDGYGRVRAMLPLGERGVLDSPLPTPAAAVTPFKLLGNLIPILLATVCGVAALFLRRGIETPRQRRSFYQDTLR